jgi:cytochrome c oxidase subunit II
MSSWKVLLTPEHGLPLALGSFLRLAHSMVARIPSLQGVPVKRRSISFVISTLFLFAFAFFVRPAGTQVAPRRIEVTVSRFAYSPAEITLKKSQPVVLSLKSSDVAHGLRFRELNLDVKIPKGGVAEMRLTPDKTGDFVGHCSVFCGSGHGEMTLTLHVVE